MTPAILHGKNPDNPDVFLRNPIPGNRILRNRRNAKVASLSQIPKQQKINLGHRILRNRSKPWVGSLPRIPKQQKINRAQEHGYVELNQKGKNQQDSRGARRILCPPEAIQRTNHRQSPPNQ